VRGGTGGQGKETRGGIGGYGGNVYIKCVNDANLYTLKKSMPKLRFIASHGTHSSDDYLIGKNGDHLILDVPPGTSIFKNSEFLTDLNTENNQVKVAEGGEGGNLKNDFQPSTGTGYDIELRLKMLADIGLVGFPNAGKSSLLKCLSCASPQISPHPFTTIKPNIGHHEFGDLRSISIADLPGLIEGSHMNRGLGHNFLKHLERNRLLLFIVDCNGTYETAKSMLKKHFPPQVTIEILLNEIKHYDSGLLNKPRILCLNKVDEIGSGKANELVEQCKKSFSGEFLDYFAISALVKINTDNLMAKSREIIDKFDESYRESASLTEKSTEELKAIDQYETKRSKRNSKNNKRRYKQELITLTNTILV